ncbi:MAG: AMP-binding protein [Candidatus Manganitrophus sp.]|nr:AMP-binding protein [Candidatus Manganitrophus sp.]
MSEGTCVSSVNPVGGPAKDRLDRPSPSPSGNDRFLMTMIEEVPAGEVGEIVVRGENVMAGYFKNPAATEEVLRGGWLHTGDLGYRDEEGFFFIVGRKKEMIIRGGENIYPKEIEERLYRHPDVLEAAVVGLPDPVWGEEVAAFIVRKPGASSTSEAIIAYCREHLARFKCPKEVIFMESFPKTATGKIQKGKLREDLSQTGHKVTSRFFDDFERGEKFTTESRTITEKRILSSSPIFREITTGSTSTKPMPKQSPFGGRIAHGLLGLSIASGLWVRLGLLEESILAFLGLEWKFVAPVRIGDAVHTVVIVKEKRASRQPDRGILTLEVAVLNQRDETVQEGIWTLLVKAKASKSGPPSAKDSDFTQAIG